MTRKLSTKFSSIRTVIFWLSAGFFCGIKTHTSTSSSKIIVIMISKQTQEQSRMIDVIGTAYFSGYSGTSSNVNNNVTSPNSPRWCVRILYNNNNGRIYGPHHIRDVPASGWKFCWTKCLYLAFIIREQNDRNLHKYWCWFVPGTMTTNKFSIRQYTMGTLLVHTVGTCKFLY